MTTIEIFNKLMEKAKSNGYEGPDYRYEIGKLFDGTNYYALIFREDFAKAIWETESMALGNLARMAIALDKWKFLEENAL